MLTRQRKTPRTPLLLSLLCAAGLLGTHPTPAGASTAGGRTYYVSPSGSDTNPGTQTAPFATIAAALNADSLNYDTLILEDGTYSGPGNRDLSFGGRTGITVESQDGAGSVTIDCGGYASSDGSGDHRGFFLNNGDQYAALKGLTITNGYESSSAPSGYAGGSGVFVGSGDNVSLVGCVFSNNYAYGSGSGVFTYGSVNIQQCDFTGNSSNGGASGDGSALNVNNGGSATAVNCLFTSNAGTAVDNFNSLTLYFCSFTQNGGGLISFDPATLTDDVFYGDNGHEVYDGGSDLTATYCDIQGGYAGTGNVDADPLFVSPPANPHLQPGSPCIGKGIDVGYEFDYDGRSRPSPPSIGAYEGSAQAATTTALSSSQNPSTAGQPVTFLANVSGQSPTGTVTFTIDGVAQTPVQVGSGGIAFLTTSALSVGSHQIIASYNGDTSNAPSTSPTLTQVVNAATTATAVTVANVTGAAGQTVTLSATLKTTAGTALSGQTLTFSIDGAAVGTGVTNSAGVATKTYVVPATLAVGSHTLTAAFAGNAADAASSGTGTLTVAATATTLTLAPATGSPGATVALKATLKAGSKALAGETLTFTVDGATVGTAVTNSAGAATLAYVIPTGDAIGSSHTTTASFGGDGSLSASTGTSTLTVTKYATALSVLAVTGTPGQTVTLSATLKTGTKAVAGETLTFTVDGASVGTAVTNASGVATLPYTLPAGDALGGHPITVTFSGDASYAAATGKGTLTVKNATALSVASISGARGTTVTLTAVLTAGGAAASGKTVTFKVDGKTVGTAVTDSTGTASLPYAIPAAAKVGGHPISVTFAGDAADNAATGAGTLTVK